MLFRRENNITLASTFVAKITTQAHFCRKNHNIRILLLQKSQHILIIFYTTLFYSNRNRSPEFFKVRTPTHITKGEGAKKGNIFLDALASLELDVPLTGSPIFREILSSGQTELQTTGQKDN